MDEVDRLLFLQLRYYFPDSEENDEYIGILPHLLELSSNQLMSLLSALLRRTHDPHLPAISLLGADEYVGVEVLSRYRIATRLSAACQELNVPVECVELLYPSKQDIRKLFLDLLDRLAGKQGEQNRAQLSQLKDRWAQLENRKVKDLLKRTESAPSLPPAPERPSDSVIPTPLVHEPAIEIAEPAVDHEESLDVLFQRKAEEYRRQKMASELIHDPERLQRLKDEVAGQKDRRQRLEDQWNAFSKPLLEQLNEQQLLQPDLEADLVKKRLRLEELDRFISEIAPQEIEQRNQLLSDFKNERKRIMADNSEGMLDAEAYEQKLKDLKERVREQQQQLAACQTECREKELKLVELNRQVENVIAEVRLLFKDRKGAFFNQALALLDHVVAASTAAREASRQRYQAMNDSRRLEYIVRRLEKDGQVRERYHQARRDVERLQQQD